MTLSTYTNQREHDKFKEVGSETSVKSVILDDSGNQITAFSNDYPSGAGTNSSVTLTNADTAYSVPTTAPTSKYTILLYNGSDTDMYWGYENSSSNGILLPSGGRLVLDIGANNSIYLYCGSAGKVITYTLKEIV